MTESTLDFDVLRDEFGWPNSESILFPTGSAPGMYARLARNKIGNTLSRLSGRHVETGILVPDPSTSATEAPMAVVCRFPMRADERLLAEAHRLAWNFCHAPVLITIDPYEIRTWSCFVAPEGFLGGFESPEAELGTKLRADEASRLAPSAAALHWLAIVGGELISKNEDKFSPEGRADRLLLENLKAVRRRLLSPPAALSIDLAHDLIARLMFLQFLFDRKDSTGVSALDADRLAELHEQGRLEKRHTGLADVLSDYEDTYRLFAWLNDRFNGDLWPAKSEDPEERAKQWDQEKRQVTPEHLRLLSELVGGTLDVESGQLTLWRLYSFDTIPLEFVSCIYEEFVSAPPEPKPTPRKGKKKRVRQPGVHYTPTHLVDFILDAVLP